MADQLKVSRIPLPKEIRLLEDQYVTMRDGIKIAYDVYLPEKEGKYPVIMAMCPYKKEAQPSGPSYGWHSEAGNLFYFVPKGYAMIYVSVRGSGKSQGVFGQVWDPIEQRDSYDIVEGIAKQSWCDGNIGMFGVSYLAVSEYYTAAQQPPHLKCIAPFNAATDWYRDFAYQLGGMYFRNFMSLWGVNLIHELLFPGKVEGKLPPPDLFGNWLSNYLDGTYWRERSAYYFIDRIKVPVLMFMQGFGGSHGRGMLRGMAKIKSENFKIVITPGATAFGAAQGSYWGNDKFNGFLQRWFDHWLKGIDTGIMKEPKVMVFDSGSGETRYENEIPPFTRTEWTKLYLHAGSATDGSMTKEAPTQELPHKFKAPRLGQDLATNKPSLIYTTPSLEKDTRVWGPLSATIYGSTATDDTSLWAWFVKVVDVDPDGTARLVSRGNLKACYRDVDESKSNPGQPWHPFEKVVYLETNKVYDFVIEVLPMFYTFKAGHSIRLLITSDDPEFKIDNGDDRVPGNFPAEISVYHDATHPSHLLLPIVPDAPEIQPVKQTIF